MPVSEIITAEIYNRTLSNYKEQNRNNSKKHIKEKKFIEEERKQK